jgi:hypothetical protein
VSEQVWGVAVMAPKQKDAAQAHCFGDCGKISMAGAINDDLTGGLFVCCEPTCPYEDTVIENYGSTMSFGRHHIVHLRLLKGGTSE